MATRVIAIDAPAKDWRRRGRAVIAVPGEKVSALQCPVPPGLRENRARSVALESVKDQIAAPSDQVQFQVAPGDGPTRTVLVAAKTDIDSWLAIRDRQKASSIALLPDYLCIPWQKDTVSVHLDDAGRLLVRWGQTMGFSAAKPLALVMLKQVRGKLGDMPERIAVTPQSAAQDQALLAALSGWGIPVAHGSGDLHLPSVSLGRSTGPVTGLGTRGKGYVGAIAAGLAALALWAGNMQAELSQLETTLSNQRAANTDLVRTSFGINGPIIDMKVQVERALDGLRAQQGDEGPGLLFPDLLNQAASVLADPQIQVTEMRYQANTLTSVVRVADFAALEALRAALIAPGFAASIARSVGDGTAGVRADVVLSEAEREGTQ